MVAFFLLCSSSNWYGPNSFLRKVPNSSFSQTVFFFTQVSLLLNIKYYQEIVFFMNGAIRVIQGLAPRLLYGDSLLQLAVIDRLLGQSVEYGMIGIKHFFWVTNPGKVQVGCFLAMNMRLLPMMATLEMLSKISFVLVPFPLK